MIEHFKLYDVGLQKVRLGNYWDGGYVLPIQALCKSEALFTYGVGVDISFEKDFVDATGKHAYCYDHTEFFDISKIPFADKYTDNIHFHSVGLSSKKTSNTDSFFAHYKQHNMTGRVLFKADIEGAETEYILNTDLLELSKITTGLIFEFHYFVDPNARQRLFECMRLLNDYFYLCHVHGNNYSSNFVYDEPVPNSQYIKQYYLPNILEVTYVNKSLVKQVKSDILPYPCPYLDRKNDLSKPECDLSFLRFI